MKEPFLFLQSTLYTSLSLLNITSIFQRTQQFATRSMSRVCMYTSKHLKGQLGLPVNHEKVWGKMITFSSCVKNRWVIISLLICLKNFLDKKQCSEQISKMWQKMSTFWSCVLKVSWDPPWITKLSQEQAIYYIFAICFKNFLTGNNIVDVKKINKNH